MRLRVACVAMGNEGYLLMVSMRFLLACAFGSEYCAAGLIVTGFS